MGSFANSFHVRSDDAAAVFAAIDGWLRLEGYQVASDAPERVRLTPPHRGIYVAEALSGWVGVMDSDLGEGSGLGANIAAELNTPVLFVLVNDSDSWMYQLFVDGDVDEFESVEGDFDGEGEVDASVAELAKSAELIKLLQSGDMAAIQAALGPQIQRMQEELEAKMPPDIRDIYERAKRGQSTPQENQKYVLWVNSNMMPRPSATGMLSGLFGGLLPTKPKPRKRKPPRENPHLKYLRPLLAEGVTDFQVAGALANQSTFAEEDLAEFLPLLGIPSLWAYLSHDYLPEMSEASLREAGVRLQAHRLYSR